MLTDSFGLMDSPLTVNGVHFIRSISKRSRSYIDADSGGMLKDDP